MKKYLKILKNAKLFAGIGENDLEAMLACLDARLASFAKGEYIFRSGERIREIAILLEGSLHIQKDDYWGNRSIVNGIASGEMFGEAYAVPGGGALANDAVAATECTVAFFDLNRLLSVCPSACRFHSLAIENLFLAISEKNRSLVARLGHIANRTTREKLLSYLSDEAKKQNASVFTIPFNRQQLADFLFVDRSAMSNELCKMRDEGLISFDKNRFSLL